MTEPSMKCGDAYQWPYAVGPCASDNLARGRRRTAYPSLTRTAKLEFNSLNRLTRLIWPFTFSVAPLVLNSGKYSCLRRLLAWMSEVEGWEQGPTRVRNTDCCDWAAQDRRPLTGLKFCVHGHQIVMDDIACWRGRRANAGTRRWLKKH